VCTNWVCVSHLNIHAMVFPLCDKGLVVINLERNKEKKQPCLFVFFLTRECIQNTLVKLQIDNSLKAEKAESTHFFIRL
jgi:hypothetical protein